MAPIIKPSLFRPGLKFVCIVLFLSYFVLQYNKKPSLDSEVSKYRVWVQLGYQWGHFSEVKTLNHRWRLSLNIHFSDLTQVSILDWNLSALCRLFRTLGNSIVSCSFSIMWKWNVKVWKSKALDHRWRRSLNLHFSNLNQVSILAWNMPDLSRFFHTLGN